MAKVIDITEKLSFDENPRIMIKDQEIEVNADAKTMLEIMGLFNNKSEVDATLAAYEKMVSENDRKKIEKLKLPFKDLMVVIEEAMSLVQGDPDGGEQ